MHYISLPKYLYILFAIPFIFSNCKKEDKRLPIVLVSEAIEISRSRANVSGKILVEYTISTSEAGFCWSENPNPDINSDIIIVKNFKVGEEFNSYITGLKPNTTYYLKAFAKAGSKTSYSEEMSFSTNNLPLNTPCQPENNLLLINLEEFRYSKVYHPYPSGSDGYTFYVGGSRSDIYITFKQKPETGKYETQNYYTSYWQSNGCKIMATLYNQVLYATEDTDVYVDNDGNGNFIITFCENSFSYSTTVFLPFNGRLVTD